MAEGRGERDRALKRVSPVSSTAGRGGVVVGYRGAVIVDTRGEGCCRRCYAAIATAGLGAETHCEWRTDLGDVGMLNRERAQVTAGVGTTAIATAIERLLAVRLVVAVVRVGVRVSVGGCCYGGIGRRKTRRRGWGRVGN
jgi:hypothetical protein